MNVVSINEVKPVKRALAFFLLVLLFPAISIADTLDYSFEVESKGARYVSDTLRYEIDVCTLSGTKVYVTHVWMQDPGKQIRKATSRWHEHLALSEDIAKKIPKAALAINGSGYVSPLYPEIPENYPGESADYYFTPLGSLTITNGELFRNLEGVPYYGLTLEKDGLHLYVGEDNETILARNPTQTWSFYEQCPLIVNGESVLDRENWPFALRKAMRTIIARLEDDSYIILTVTSLHGLPLTTCTDFLLGEYHPVWAYNLDGGPSTALIRRLHGRKAQKLIYGSRQKVVDVMAFVELPDAN